MVLALGILAVLMVAGQSAIRIAGHSLPSSSSPTYSAGNGQRALAQLASELSYATSITSMTSTSVTFTVAARGGDSSPETICYSWDGVIGDPLKRQYNSNAAVNLVTGVNAFSLLYDKRSAAAATTYSTSARTTLYSYDNNLPWNSTAGLASSLWLSQSFTPTLPANATTWTVTSIKFKGCQDTHAGGQFYVQIRPSSGAVPSQSVLQQTTVNGSSMPNSIGWQQVNFASPVSMPAGVQGALTFQWVSDASYYILILGPYHCPPVDIQYQSSGASSLAPAYSSDSGNTWTNSNGTGIYCYVYGTYTTPNPPILNYFLENVRASLQLGSNADAAVRTGIPILNQPQVTGP